MVVVYFKALIQALALNAEEETLCKVVGIQDFYPLNTNKKHHCYAKYLGNVSWCDKILGMG